MVAMHRSPAPAHLVARFRPASRTGVRVGLFVALGVALASTGCRTVATKPAPPSPTPVLAAGALAPSSRLIIGRVIAVDPARASAVVELAPDAPHGSLMAGTELIVRTLDLRETARVQVSPYLRGRVLGTKIVAGQPSPGDEVVWLAP